MALFLIRRMAKAVKEPQDIISTLWKRSYPFNGPINPPTPSLVNARQSLSMNNRSRLKPNNYYISIFDEIKRSNTRSSNERTRYGPRANR